MRTIPKRLCQEFTATTSPPRDHTISPPMPLPYPSRPTPEVEIEPPVWVWRGMGGVVERSRGGDGAGSPNVYLSAACWLFLTTSRDVGYLGITNRSTALRQPARLHWYAPSSADGSHAVRSRHAWPAHIFPTARQRTNQGVEEQCFTAWRALPQAADAHHGHARPSSRPRERSPLRGLFLPIVPRCSSSAARAR